MAQYRRGDVVLDFGSGCGHQATLLTQLFGVHVIGIDVNRIATQWAREHSVGEFHLTNGKDLTWIPDQAIDHLFSFAAVYYVPPEDLCQFSRGVIRILKPGGTALFGWLYGQWAMQYPDWRERGFPEVTDKDAKARLQPQQLFDCLLLDTSVDVQIIDDSNFWSQNTKAAKTEIISNSDTFSVLLRKL